MTIDNRLRAWRISICAATGAMSLLTNSAILAADLGLKDTATPAPALYDWTGLYIGGHTAYAWGTSNWAASTIGGDVFARGSLDFAQPINSFSESGSFFNGAQVGYNFMLANRFVIGAEADFSAPSFPSVEGLSVGGVTALASPAGGLQTYSESVLNSGTIRGRIGYVPAMWPGILLYATGGFAWTYDQLALIQANGFEEDSVLFRMGWAAGAGVEVPFIPHWTARLEYLHTDYGKDTTTFPISGQRFASDLSLDEVRLGVNYKFDDNTEGSAKDPKAPSLINPDDISIHGQMTATIQGYPAISSLYQGQNSLPHGGETREVADATLYAGFRLWGGAELWIDPEIDQGFGIGDTHGLAGYANGESYKLGSATPYARFQRYFVRQTINLGGESEKVEADTNQFAGTQTSDRLVLTAGKFSIVDIFDTNKFANAPRSDFLNWTLINAGTFDYAGDAWGYTYGAAAEWYTGRWTLRGGVFDLSATPAGGDSPLAYGLDPTFKQLEYVAEVEERHDLWGQPGKVKVTGFVSVGRAGLFQDANALALLTGQPADITLVRDHYNAKPGVSLNVEQQVTKDLGVFMRAGWADGTVEPWDFTDVDASVQMGVSIAGTQWGRPDDRIGIAGVINSIEGVHQEFFNLGGLGILIGDGKLTNPGVERLIEAYYSYAFNASTKLSVDYQFIDNPAYNTDRGPVNTFAGRFHWQF